MAGKKKWELALEELRNGAAWEEVSKKYSDSVLYSALEHHKQEMAAEIKETRRTLAEAKAELSGTEEKLRRSKTDSAEAEKKINLLEVKRRDLERENSSLEQKIEAQGRLLGENQKALISLKSLNDSEVTNEDITCIHATVTEYEGSPQAFKKRIEELEGLDAYMLQKRVAVRELEEREQQLTATVSEKEGKLSRLDDTFIQRGREYQDRLDECLRNVESSSKSLDVALNNLMDKHGSALDARTAELFKKLEETLETRNKKLALGVESLAKTIDKTRADLENIRNTTFETVRMVNRLANLLVLADMMSGENVDTRILLLQLHIILGKSARTLENNGLTEHAKAIDDAQGKLMKLEGIYDL